MWRSSSPSAGSMSRTETVRSWVLNSGRSSHEGCGVGRPRPSNRWHLDEMVIRIASRHMYLWRAVDDEGEVLEILVQRRRDKCASVKLMRKLLRKQGFAPKTVTTASCARTTQLLTLYTTPVVYLYLGRLTRQPMANRR